MKTKWIRSFFDLLKLGYDHAMQERWKKKLDILAQTPFSTIEWYPTFRFIALRLKNPLRASYDRFKEVQIEFAELASVHNARNILIDTRNFSIEVPDDYANWLALNVDAKFKVIPVKRIATLVTINVYQFFKSVEIDYDGMSRKIFYQ